jgi:hypothetical protein
LLITPQQSGYPGGEAISPQVWRADSFYAMAELLMRGLGWAWLPRHGAVPDLPGADGRAGQRVAPAPALVASWPGAAMNPWARRAMAGRAFCSALARDRVNSAAMNRTLYTCCFTWAAAGRAAPVLRARKAPAYGQRIGERFCLQAAGHAPGGIWVHAVSVGESIAARRWFAPAQAYPAARSPHLHDPDRLRAHPRLCRRTARAHAASADCRGRRALLDAVQPKLASSWKPSCGPTISTSAPSAAAWRWPMRACLRVRRGYGALPG